MGCLMIYHPDIEEFLEAKSWEEGKLNHFNLSVLVDDEFMKAKDNNEMITLRYPCMYETGELVTNPSEWKITKEVNAKELWDKIMTKAYNTGEYGVLFYDNMNKDNNLKYMETIITTNPCFTGDMRLLTDKGFMTFEELCDTEPNVISYDGKISKGKVWCNGEKDTIKLIMSNGKEITCTPDHRFMTIDGEECEAKNLKNKKIMPKMYKTIENNETYIKLGFIQGDGQLSRLDSELHQGIEVNIGCKDGDIRYLFENDDYTEKSYRVIYLQGYNEMLENLGFSHEILPYRIMPKSYNEWDLNKKSNFLQGCFSANGCVNSNRRISYKTTCKDFALELIKTLEKDFGITANLTINKKHMVEFENGEYECRESYDVNINKYNDILLFAQFIGFYQTYKNIKLQNLIMERVPYVRNIKNNGKELVYDFNEPINHWGIVEGYVAHNCGEYLAGTLYKNNKPLENHLGACNLGSLFLHNFVENPFTKDAKINYADLRYAIEVAIRMLDNVIDINNYPLEAYENYQKGVRTIGLGVTGLADMLCMLNIKYDSKEAVEFVDNLMDDISFIEYETSIMLAKEKGAFPYLEDEDREKFASSNYIMKHYEKSSKWKKIIEGIKKYGIRNARLQAVAPTGTLSLTYGNNCSSGLEPIFSLEYERKIKFGGQDDSNIQIYPMRDYAYGEWLKVKDNEKCIVKEDVFQTAMDLSVDAHINILGVMAFHTDMSCSKTINIPTDYPFKKTKEVYDKCHKLGIKGCTIFRPNPVRQGILVTEKQEEQNKQEEEVKELKHGTWLPKPNDIVYYERKVYTGCSKLILFISWSQSENRIVDVFVKHTSKGGCKSNIDGIVILMSGILRYGGNLQSIQKALEGVGTCNSFNNAKNKGMKLSKGTSCPTAILNTILEFEQEMKGVKPKKIDILNKMNEKKEEEIFTEEEKKFLKENGEGAFALKYNKCPQCGTEILHTGGCVSCPSCSFSKCE
jgi:ribonucleoside-diphosphate reductase alpha chain